MEYRIFLDGTATKKLFHAEDAEDAIEQYKDWCRNDYISTYGDAPDEKTFDDVEIIAYRYDPYE